MKNFTKKLNRMVTCLMGSGMILSLEPVSAMQTDPAREEIAQRGRTNAHYSNVAIIHEKTGNPELAHYFHERQALHDAAHRNPFTNEYPGESLRSYFSPENYPSSDYLGSLFSDPSPGSPSWISELASCKVTYYW